MPIEIKDSDGGLGNIITSRGILTDKEFADALKQHLTQDKNKFRNYKYSLCDYSAVKKIKVSTQSIQLIADYCKKSSIANSKVVVAIVAKQDVIYGMARMWEILSEATKWETMVSRNREEAEAWIKQRVKQKYGIDDLTFS
jgi:hypothetical protein